MSQGDDDSEKSQEPSQKKLDDARKKGEVPRSNDLTTAAGYAGIVLTATTFGGSSLQSVGGSLQGAFVLAGGDRGQMVVSSAMITQSFGALLPWVVLPFAFACSERKVEMWQSRGSCWNNRSSTRPCSSAGCSPFGCSRSNRKASASLTLLVSCSAVQSFAL